MLAASDCTSLVPPDWYQKGIPSADLPADKTAGAWIAFGDAQTGQLDKANAQTADTFNIIHQCEQRDRATAKALAPKPWWHFW